MPYTADSSSGGTSPTSRALAYRHLQTEAATVWTIAHGLGFRPAGVQVTDSDGHPVEGVVSSPDADTTLITFSTPVAGLADLS